MVCWVKAGGLWVLQESYVCVGLDKGRGEDGPAQRDSMSRSRGEWKVQVIHCC